MAPKKVTQGKNILKTHKLLFAVSIRTRRSGFDEKTDTKMSGYYHFKLLKLVCSNIKSKFPLKLKIKYQRFTATGSFDR
jgi:hypothetical protein